MDVWEPRKWLTNNVGWFPNTTTGLLTLLTGTTPEILALTAAAAIADALGIGVCELLTKSGMLGGVTAYHQQTTPTLSVTCV